jgi:hypothetical protein
VRVFSLLAECVLVAANAVVPTVSTASSTTHTRIMARAEPRRVPRASAAMNLDRLT